MTLRNFEIYWETKKEYADRLTQEGIQFDFDNDYYLPTDSCTYIFFSVDDCVKAIQLLFPMATFSLAFNLSYKIGQVCDFDDHLWELKEHRK